MPDLEKQIEAWRREMTVAGIKPPALDELDNHLREDIEQQLRLKCTEQQAFEIAVGRIGQADVLKMEFKKNRGSKEAKQRKKAKFFLGTIYGCCAFVLVEILCKNEMTFSERLSGFASVAAMLLLIVLARQIVRRYAPIITSKAVQSVIAFVGCVSGLVWFMAFAYLILPRYELLPGQLVVAVCWALIPMLVLPVAGFLVADKSERAQWEAGDS